MEIETKNDVRLVGRAMKEGWPVDRQKVIDALHDVIDRRDPDLMLGAAQLLIKADELNAKREAIEQRKLGTDGDQRLRLLELAQRIPAPELAKLASERGYIDG